MLGRLGIALLGGVVAQEVDGAAVETYAFSFTADIPRSGAGEYPAIFVADREPFGSEEVRGDLRVVDAHTSAPTGSTNTLGVGTYSEAMDAGHFSCHYRHGELNPKAKGASQGRETSCSLPCTVTTRLRALSFEVYQNGELKVASLLDSWTTRSQKTRQFRIGEHPNMRWGLALGEHLCETGKSCVRPLRAVGNAGKCALLEIFTQELREI